MAREIENPEFDNDETDWAPDEWDEIQKGNINREIYAWSVPRPEGNWEVWRGCGDDSHERLYRSPSGQYFLGSVRCTGWAGRWWRDTIEITHPYQDATTWMADPLQAAPPSCLQYASLPGVECWGDVFRRAAKQPLEFMRVVAAAWFLCWPEGDYTEPYEGPDELAAIAAELQAEASKDRKREISEAADLLCKQRDAIRKLLFGGQTGGYTLEWLSSIGGADVVRRAEQEDSLKGPECIEAVDQLIGRFMDIVIDDLLALREREQSDDDPIIVLLEDDYGYDVDKDRMTRAVARIDAAADRAVRKLVA